MSHLSYSYVVPVVPYSLDSRIGGCLIMGDRGTAKSVAVRSLAAGPCKRSPHTASPFRFAAQL
jgi:hypothetical protein